MVQVLGFIFDKNVKQAEKNIICSHSESITTSQISFIRGAKNCQLGCKKSCRVMLPHFNITQQIKAIFYWKRDLQQTLILWDLLKV